MRSRRSLGVVAVLATAATLLSACSGPNSSGSGGGSENELKVGLVVPITGSLSAFGEPDQWVADQVTKWFDGHPMKVKGKKVKVDILVKDSQSDPKRASEVAANLINNDHVQVLMALSTPETTVPVTQQCEANHVACITADTPWQPWFYGSGGKDNKPLQWSHHFFWGLEDVSAVLSNMWDQLPTNKRAAALFPNDSDGTAWAGAVPGLLKPAGYKVDNPGLFSLDTQDFSSQIARFKKNDDQILMGVVPPPVFAAFWKQAKQQGYHPKVVTVPKALEFPSAIEALGDLGNRLGVEVWWSPNYPTKSSLTGLTSAEFAKSYTASTGKQWTMPMAFPESLFEVLNAAVQKAGSTSSAAINSAMKGLQVDTLVGPLDWSKGPNANVAKSLLTGGQWQKSSGGKFPVDLTIVSNSLAPSVPTAGKLQPLE